MGFYRKPLEETVPSYVEIITNGLDLYHNDASSSYQSSSVQVKNSDGQLTYLPTSNFALTSSNVFNGNQTINGNLNINGNINVSTLISASIIYQSGSTKFGNTQDDTHQFTGSLQISGSLYYNGHKQYNYGQFYDMTTQSGSSGSIQSMKLGTIDEVSGVLVVSGSRITVENAGVYNLQFSAQLENTTNTNIVFNIWFAKNGNSIPNSNTHIDVSKAQSAGLGKVPAAWNFLSHLNDNDYLEIKWTCNDNAGILHMDAGTVQIPATPSVIATITQIA